MYVIFKNGAKQYRVSCFQTVRLEKLNASIGEIIKFDNVLMVANGDDIKIGTPLVEGIKIKAEVITHGRSEKIKIIKFHRRKHSRKQQGHRQWFTDVRITDIY
ncbi:MAG: 50S ribosomal protein L21 [Arsenophonus sp.]